MVKKVKKESDLDMVSLYLNKKDWLMTNKIAEKNKISAAFLARKWMKEGIEREKKRG